MVFGSLMLSSMLGQAVMAPVQGRGQSWSAVSSHEETGEVCSSNVADLADTGHSPIGARRPDSTEAVWKRADDSQHTRSATRSLKPSSKLWVSGSFEGLRPTPSSPPSTVQFQGP